MTANSLLDGQKGFCSGTRGSQMMTLSAHDPATGKPIFAVVPTTREGITVHDDWDPVGQRQTDSGKACRSRWSVVELHEVLHKARHAVRELLRTLISLQKKPDQPVRRHRAPGVLKKRAAYVTQHGRPWISSGVDRRWTDDPYLIQRFGEMRSRRRWAPKRCLYAPPSDARRCLAARRAALRPKNAAHVGACHLGRRRIVSRIRRRSTSRNLFDACGARATHVPPAQEKFWRNDRVHTVRSCSITAFARPANLRGTLPEVSLYT